MDYLPIFADIRNRPCLVVGAGDVAARKVELLLGAGARVTVVAPAACDAIRRYQAQERIRYHARRFVPADLNDTDLVIAATDDADVNRSVSENARARRLPVNVVDQPALCSFIVPSIVDRSPVVAAVSTGGSAPVLARMLRARLEIFLPAACGRLAGLIAEYRGEVSRRLGPLAARRLWEDVTDGPIAEMVLAGREQDARKALNQAIDTASGESAPAGEVYLVGAGPGDPDLLTLRALRLLQRADIVLYDRLVDPRVLTMARRDAEFIYVGKRKAYHAVRQEEINRLLVQKATEGKRVMRLKGGDPFIFGRGGEEIDDLARHGIPVQIVPGITAASGCAAYAGIPLTHRDHAQSCVFVTGHLRDGSLDLNWDLLCQPRQTVVVYMGLTGVDSLCRGMITRGTPATMPAALIERGTTPAQRVLTGTLATLPDIIHDAEVHAPTLIIVGDVVRLADRYRWFGDDNA